MAERPERRGRVETVDLAAATPPGAETAACRQCAEPVLWVPRPKGKPWYPPLNPGSKKQMKSGRLRYLIHVCAPAAVQARKKAIAAEAAQRAKEVAASQAAYRQQRADAQKRRDEVEAFRAAEWHRDLRLPCRKCGAKVGSVCSNLSERQRGRVAEVKWPHAVRSWDALAPAEREGRFTEAERAAIAALDD